MMEKRNLKSGLVLMIAFLVLAISCKRNQPAELDASYLHEWNQALEKGIVNDFFSPPVAGRMYTYPNLIAYTVLTNGENEIQPLLKNFVALPKVDKDNQELVALYAFYFVGKKMVYSYNFLDEYLSVFEERLTKAGYEAAVMNKAKEKAEEISVEFLKWVAMDGYKETRSDTKFSLCKKPGSWKPTPPDFMDAL